MALFGNAIIIAFVVSFRCHGCVALCACVLCLFFSLILNFSHIPTNKQFIQTNVCARTRHLRLFTLSTICNPYTRAHSHTNRNRKKRPAREKQSIEINRMKPGIIISSVITMISILLLHDAISTFRSLCCHKFAIELLDTWGRSTAQ